MNKKQALELFTKIINATPPLEWLDEDTAHYEISGIKFTVTYDYDRVKENTSPNYFGDIVWVVENQ